MDHLGSNDYNLWVDQQANKIYSYIEKDMLSKRNCTYDLLNEDKKIVDSLVKIIKNRGWEYSIKEDILSISAPDNIIIVNGTAYKASSNLKIKDKKIIRDGMSPLEIEGIVKIEIIGQIGNITSDISLNIKGTVIGDAKADTINCADVAGNVEAYVVSCNRIDGSVNAKIVNTL